MCSLSDILAIFRVVFPSARVGAESTDGEEWWGGGGRFCLVNAETEPSPQHLFFGPRDLKKRTNTRLLPLCTLYHPLALNAVRLTHWEALAKLKYSLDRVAIPSSNRSRWPFQHPLLPGNERFKKKTPAADAKHAEPVRSLCANRAPLPSS